MRCVANKAIAINGGFAYGGTPCRNSKPATMRRTERPSHEKKPARKQTDVRFQINERTHAGAKCRGRQAGTSCAFRTFPNGRPTPGLAKDRARKDIDEWLSTVQ
jgi:hypothetical protein